MKKSTKVDGRPSAQFYPRDYMGDAALALCSFAAQGLWMRMLCAMWDSPERGVLLLPNGAPPSVDQVAVLVNAPRSEPVAALLGELEAMEVYSRRGDDEAIYSRRMVRDEEIRSTRAEAGSKGGKGKQTPEQTESKTPSKRKAKPQANGKQNGKQNDPPSSSSSSSPSSPSSSVDSSAPASTRERDARTGDANSEGAADARAGADDAESDASGESSDAETAAGRSASAKNKARPPARRARTKRQRKNGNGASKATGSADSVRWRDLSDLGRDIAERINWGRTNLRPVQDAAERLTREFAELNGVLAEGLDAVCEPGLKPWDVYTSFRAWNQQRCLSRRREESPMERAARERAEMERQNASLSDDEREAARREYEKALNLVGAREKA